MTWVCVIFTHVYTGMHTHTHSPEEFDMWSALSLITPRQGQHDPVIAIYRPLTELGLQVHAATPEFLHGCRGLELGSSC